MRRLFPILLTLLALFQTVKGLGLAPKVYPLSRALFTYADGPVRRGLVPSVMGLFGINSVPDQAVAMSWLHLLLMGGLVFVLVVMALQREGLRRALPILLISGALLPVTAATVGFSDVLLFLGLIGMQSLLQKKQMISACLLLLVLVLVHELVLPCGLALLLAHQVFTEDKKERQRGWVIITATFIIVAAWLGLTSLWQHNLVDEAVRRCTFFSYDAEEETFCRRQMTAHMATEFTPTRVILLPFYALAFGLIPLVFATLALGQARRDLRRGLLLLPLMFMGYGLISIAWDGDRVFNFTLIVFWLIFDRWLEAVPQPQLRHGKFFLIILILAQLMLTYPTIGFYSSHLAVSPTITRQIFINAGAPLAALMAKAGLNPPTPLNPKNCQDPRCFQP